MMPELALTWTLARGHEVPMLEHETSDEPPSRPRMCPICGRLRNVVVG